MRVHSAKVTTQFLLLNSYICYAELVNIKRMKYYYDRGDYEGMRSKCKSINWDEVLSGDTQGIS